jgi:hypothetical protein
MFEEEAVGCSADFVLISTRAGAAVTVLVTAIVSRYESDVVVLWEVRTTVVNTLLVDVALAVS